MGFAPLTTSSRWKQLNWFCITKYAPYPKTRQSPDPASKKKTALTFQMARNSILLFIFQFALSIAEVYDSLADLTHSTG